MILPDRKDAKHKAWLYRLLTAICDQGLLADFLRFKGGTCSAMRGFLDRFSVDLDFDFVAPASSLAEARVVLEKIFAGLGLEIKDQSAKVPQYFLRYPAETGERNTIKIDITLPPPKTNKYEAVRLSEIDRIFICQTKETGFANKLVAAIERYEKNGSIAGRDIYDIHHYFLNGFEYEKEVIIERRGTGLAEFFESLAEFVENQITDTIIGQDINSLLPYDKFRKIRKSIKPEVLTFLRDELHRLKA